MNTSKYIVLLSLFSIFSSCQMDKNKDKTIGLNNRISIDSTIPLTSIKNKNSGSLGSKILFQDYDRSVKSCNAILEGKLLNICMSNGSFCLNREINIQIADSLFYITCSYSSDIGRYEFIPITQKLILSKFPVNYNDTISGFISFNGFCLDENGYSKINFSGGFSCKIEGDTNKKYCSLEEAKKASNYVLTLNLDDYSDNGQNEIILSSLTNLKHIRINKLAKFPVVITKLNKLETIDFSFSEITEIPIEISKLQNLRALRLINSKIAELPASITNCNNLEDLCIRNNPRFNYASIQQLKNLKILDIGLNNLTLFPSEIFKLKKIEELCLGGNNFNYHLVLNQLHNFKNLKKLELWYCKFKKIPKELYALQNLEELNLSFNPLPLSEINKLKSKLPNTEIIYDLYYEEDSE